MIPFFNPTGQEGHVGIAIGGCITLVTIGFLLLALYVPGSSRDSEYDVANIKFALGFFGWAVLFLIFGLYFLAAVAVWVVVKLLSYLVIGVWIVIRSR